MDEYRNQNSDDQNGSNQPHPSESPYNSGSSMDTQSGQAPNQPPYGQQPWQNAPNSDQQYWQNGSQNSQQPWQNGQQNNQQYWQNGSQNNQQYWQNGSPGSQPYWQNGQPQKKRNNLALASMIVGIFALITCCVPFIQFPLAVTAIVLVILSKKKQPLRCGCDRNQGVCIAADRRYRVRRIFLRMYYGRAVVSDEEEVL